MRDFRGFPEKWRNGVAIFGTNFAHFAFAHYSCALHQSFNPQPNVGKRHRPFPKPSLIFRSFPMRFTLPLIALAAIAAPIAPASAEKLVTVRIGYADVDVTTAEGRAALEARIEARLRKACSLEAAARYSFSRADVDSKCLADARTAARAEIERVAAAEMRSGREVAAN
jgi:UrcA family protein